MMRQRMQNRCVSARLQCRTQHRYDRYRRCALARANGGPEISLKSLHQFLKRAQARTRTPGPAELRDAPQRLRVPAPDPFSAVYLQHEHANDPSSDTIQYHGAKCRGEKWKKKPGKKPRFQPRNERQATSSWTKEMLAAHARGFVETATEKTSPPASPNQGLPVSSLWFWSLALSRAREHASSLGINPSIHLQVVTPASNAVPPPPQQLGGMRHRRVGQGPFAMPTGSQENQMPKPDQPKVRTRNPLSPTKRSKRADRSANYYS
ncbi:hypothetical protein J3F83DRAFT_190083 [Trichoderma novae-zelandiae]